MIYFENVGETAELAKATWWANGKGNILEADIRINDSWVWTTTGAFEPGRGCDLQSVVTHELGHWLSLGHDDDPSCQIVGNTSSPVMCPQYTLGTLKRNLHQNDINGIVYIYPGLMDTPTLPLTERLFLPRINR